MEKRKKGGGGATPLNNHSEKTSDAGDEPMGSWEGSSCGNKKQIKQLRGTGNRNK